MFRIIVDSLKTGLVTEKRPFEARPPFGFPVIDFSRCTLCEECARACPTGAIHTTTPAPGRRTLALSYAACIQCRECVTSCTEHAVSVGRDVEVAAHTREQLQRTASFDVDTATARCTSGRWTLAAVTAANWKLPRRRIRSLIWNGLASISWPVHGMRMCCSSQ